MKKLLMVLALLPLMAAADGDYTWDVRENGDGTLTIRGVIGKKPTGVLTIPSTYGGKPVKQVGEEEERYEHERGVFAGCGITGLVIEDGVEVLGYGAFNGCKNLASVKLPSTLKVIRENCFKGCSALKSIDLPEGLQKVESDFLHDTAVSTLNIPSTLVDIEEGALAIPSGRKFTVAEGNPRYRVENGYIYDFVNNVVFMRADYYQKTFAIPDGAARIAECCFGDCDGGNITIPPSVRRIDYGAFCACQGLTVTFMGEEPEVWGGDIFIDSTNVKVYVQPGQGWDDVVMRGTWLGVSIGYGGGNPRFSLLEVIPGEAVSFDTGFIGYTAKGLPSGLKYDKKTGKITGAAKKPTAASGVTVKFTKKGEPDAELTIIVGPMPKLSIALTGDTEKCKVKGAGDYPVGKKVSLSATAPKGAAFVGWFANGAPWPNGADHQKTKLSYVMTKADVSLVAKFEKEKMSVGCAGLEGGAFTVGVTGGAGIPLEIETQSGVKSVKVTKLPAGMKYNAKTRLIEGAPTKAGDFTVQIAVTAKSGAVEKKDIAVHVDPLPDWAVGTFSGMIGRWLGLTGEKDAAFYGSLQFTVKATGAVSAKVTAGGKTYSFSAKGFGGVEDGEAFLSRVRYPDVDEVACRVSDTLVLDLATKKGDALLLGVTLFQKSGHLLVSKVGGTFVRNGCATPYELVGWRNEAGKDSRIAPGTPAAEAVARLKGMGKVYLKARELEPGAGGARHFALDWRGGEPLHRYGSKEADVTLSVDKSGNVKVSGKIDGVKLTASTPLRIGGNEWFTVTADSIAYDKKSGMDYEFILGWDTIDPRTGVISVTPDPNADASTAGSDMHEFELWVGSFE